MVTGQLHTLTFLDLDFIECLLELSHIFMIPSPHRIIVFAVEMQKYKPAYYILKTHYIFVAKTVRKYELDQSKHTAI